MSMDLSYQLLLGNNINLASSSTFSTFSTLSPQNCGECFTNFQVNIMICASEVHCSNPLLCFLLFFISDSPVSMQFSRPIISLSISFAVLFRPFVWEALPLTLQESQLSVDLVWPTRDAVSRAGCLPFSRPFKLSYFQSYHT